MNRRQRIARHIRQATQDEDALRVLFGPQFSLRGWEIRDLSPKNVKKTEDRYKSMILQNHPDRYRDPDAHLRALQKTKELNESWDHLRGRLPKVVPPQNFGECMETRGDLDMCDEMFSV